MWEIAHLVYSVWMRSPKLCNIVDSRQLIAQNKYSVFIHDTQYHSLFNQCDSEKYTDVLYAQSYACCDIRIIFQLVEIQYGCKTISKRSCHRVCSDTYWTALRDIVMIYKFSGSPLHLDTGRCGSWSEHVDGHSCGDHRCASPLRWARDNRTS